MTSTEPTPAGPDAALCDALVTEHGVIYGYGVVSAYSPPDL
ncbi:MAG: ferritin-like domain-containing protein, partial [Mycobacterium sp.]